MTRLPSFYFDPADAAFFTRTLGFIDSDGHVTNSDLHNDVNAEFQSFYEHLRLTDPTLLKVFAEAATPETRLQASRFADDARAVRLAREWISYSQEKQIITDRGLPELLDPTLYDYPWVLETRGDTPLYKHPDARFDALNIDVASIASTPGASCLLDGTARFDHTFVLTPTLELLSKFLQNHKDDTSFTLTFTDWESAFQNNPDVIESYDTTCRIEERALYPSGRAFTPRTTWEELLLIWQASATSWEKWIINDTTISIATWGINTFTDNAVSTPEFGRVARGDFTLTGEGLLEYWQPQLLDPDTGDFDANALNSHYWFAPAKDDRFVIPPNRGSHEQAIASVDHADIRILNTWPADELDIEIPLGGLTLKLKAAPGATVSANANIDQNSFIFDPTIPLIGLDGFSIELKGTSFADKAARLALKELIGTVPVGLTVFRNRLTLVMCKVSDNPKKPDSYFLLDVGTPLRGILNAKNEQGGLADALFANDGQLLANASLTDLQSEVIAAIKNKDFVAGSSQKITDGLDRRDLQQVRTEAWIKEAHVTLDQNFLTETIPPSDSFGISSAEMAQGNVYALRDIPGEQFFMQGSFTFELGINAPKLGLTKSQKTHATLEFFADGLKTNHAGAYVGYARLRFPSINAPGNGLYGGELLIGLSLAGFDELLDGNDPAALLQHVWGQVLVNLQKDGKDFLAAGFYAQAIKTDDAYTKLADLLDDYKIDYSVAMNDGQELLGVFSGEVFYGVHLENENPADVALGLTITSQITALGGPARLFGRDAAIAVYKDTTGAIHLLPRFSKASMTKAQIHGTANDLQGEIILTPVIENGKTTSFTINFNNLAISIPDAELETERVDKDHPEISLGRTLWRGNIKQARLNGTVRVSSDKPEASWFDIINLETWNFSDQAPLTLTLENASLKGFDALTGRSLPEATPFMSVEGTSLTTKIFNISQLSLKPSALSGTLEQLASQGNFAFKAGPLTASGDIKVADITASGTLIPDVRFNTPKLATGINLHETLPEYVPHPITPIQQAVIDRFVTEPVEELLPNSVDQGAFADRSEVYRALKGFLETMLDLARTLRETDVSVDGLDLAPYAEYKKSPCHKNDPAAPERGRLKLLPGIIGFLNPVFTKDTQINKDTVAISAEDYHFTDFSIKTNQPFTWAGFHVTGIKLAPKPGENSDPASWHLYLTTEHHQIDLFPILALLKPCKTEKLYQQMRQHLHDTYLSEPINNFLQTQEHQRYSEKEILRFQENFSAYAQGKKKCPQKFKPLYDAVILFHTKRAIDEFERPLRRQDRTDFNELVLVDDYSTASERQAYVARTLKYLASDLDLPCGEIPHQTGDFFDFMNRAVDVFAPEKKAGLFSTLTDTFINKKKPKPSKPKDPEKTIFGVSEQTHIAAEFGMHLRPLHSELAGVSVDITRDNPYDVTTEIDFWPDTAANLVGNQPGLLITVAGKPGEALTDVHFSSDMLETLSGDLLSASGLYFTMSGNPNKGGTFVISAKKAVLGNLDIDYAADGPNSPRFQIRNLPHDLEHPNFVVMRDIEIKTAKDTAGFLYFDTKLVLDHAEAGGGWLSYRQNASQQLYFNQSGASLKDFYIHAESRHYRFEDKDNPEAKGMSRVDFHGVISQPENPQLTEHEPWFAVQIGTNENGEPEFLFFERVAIDQAIISGSYIDPAVAQDGELQNPITIEGNFSLIATLPRYADSRLLKLQDKGINVNFDSVEIGDTRAGKENGGGSLAFSLNGKTGSLRRSTGLNGDKPEPVFIKFNGSVTIDTGQGLVTISDIVVPFEDVVLELTDDPIQGSTDNGAEATKLKPQQGAVLKSFRTPVGEAITAHIEGAVGQENISVVGSRGLPLDGGEISISAAGGLQVGMDDVKNWQTLRFEAEGFQAKLKAGHNVLDLKAGKIYFHDLHGEILEWTIPAELSDYFYGTSVKLAPLMSGHRMELAVDPSVFKTAPGASGPPTQSEHTPSP